MGTTIFTKMNRLNYLSNIPVRERFNIVALDCEMVGSIDNKSLLARATLLNGHGDVLLDEYCMPSEEIKEMRTSIHGITIDQLKGKQSDYRLKSKIAKILKNKKLVGHSVDKDLAVLGIDHPEHLIRDTAYKFSWTICRKKPSLQRLTWKKLRVNIQEGAHDSYEDTLAALMVYVRYFILSQIGSSKAKEYHFW